MTGPASLARRPALLLAALAAALLARAGLAQAPRPSPPPRLAVLLYDGRLEEQVRLEAEVAAAMIPHAGRIRLKSMHAGRAENVPFMRKHSLQRSDAPVLLVMAGADEGTRVARKVPLRRDVEPGEGARQVLAALRLPVPRRLVAPPEPGVAASLRIAGSPDAEAGWRVSAAGPQRVTAEGRLFQAGSVAIYRVRIPGAVRRADLRLKLGGSFVVDWSAEPDGPWKTLASSARLYAPGEEFGDAPEAVFNLDALLQDLPGDLYLRVSPGGSGSNRCVLTGIELAVLGPREESGEQAFRRAAEDRRARAMRAMLPSGVATPLGGLVKGRLVLQAEESPYVLLEDLEVPFDAELEIRPGVRILVAGPRRITVLGRLTAEGEPSAPIRFEPGRPSQADDWKGILFPAIRAARPPGPSRLAYCRFVNAAELGLAGFAGTIVQCHFEGGLIGIRLRTDPERSPASCVITRNRFSACQTGLLIEGGGAEITRNTWSGCMVSISVGALPRRPALRLAENNILASRVSALRYLPASPAQAATLPAGGNHWGGAEAAAIPGRGSGPVQLEPLLNSPVTPAGPDWEPD